MPWIFVDTPIFKYSILGPTDLNLSKNRVSYTVATTYWVCQLSIYCLLLPNSPFFALLYDTGDRPCKHFLANPYHVGVCQERMLEGLRRKKGLLLILVPVCSLIAPVCSRQQHMGHQMASLPADSNGTQRAAAQRSLGVASPSLSYIPQTSPPLHGPQLCPLQWGLNLSSGVKKEPTPKCITP